MRLRLQVKRRLNKKHKEELDGLLVASVEEEGEGAPEPSQLAERRKARLEEIYQQVTACNSCNSLEEIYQQAPRVVWRARGVEGA